MGKSVRLVLCTFGLIATGMLLVVMFSSRVVRAEVPARAWSWSAHQPTVFESNQVDSVAGSNYCDASYQLQEIAGTAGTKQVCMAIGEHVKFGMYYAGSAFRIAVSFKYDSKMYQVVGAPCEQSLTCRYLPGSDTLVTSQHIINGHVRSLVIYKNFTKRLIKAVDSLPSNRTYFFDAADPDYMLQNTSGYAWPVGGFAGSDDGQWLAVEFRQLGIGLLNLETMQMKRISPVSFNYGMGFDPASEFAVSNSGRHVAIMGANAGLNIYDIVPGCGDILTDNIMVGGMPIKNPCKLAKIEPADFIDRFWSGTHPRFDDEGSELSFYAISYPRETREVVLRVDGYVNQRVDYLALGDSYSSGEGESEDAHYLPGTNDEFEKCHISDRSYPFLIAKVMGIESQYVKSVACSGAVTGDVVGSDLAYWGQKMRLGAGYLDLTKPKKFMYQTAAKESFVPGRVHQIDFVKRYHPKVITIGIGGNDAGFMDKLVSCIGPGTCNWAGKPIDREKTAVEVKGLFNILVNTYTEIHNASPRSKVYVIGYPKIINAVSTCGTYGVLLDSTERQFMNQGIVYINDIVAAAADKAGVKYIDIENSFGNQVLCGTGKPTVMNGIRPGDDSGLSENTQMVKVIGQEGFHPLPTGHAKTALQILTSVPNMLTYSNCTGVEVVCPADRGAPEPSEYWIAAGSPRPVVQQRAAVYALDRTGAQNNRQKSIKIPSYTFAAQSVITAEIHSDPVALGMYRSDDSGAAVFDIELPQNLTEGYHTMHLYGTSFSGEPIDLYQVIHYQLPDQPMTNTSTAKLMTSNGKNVKTGKRTASESGTRTSHPDSAGVLGLSDSNSGGQLGFPSAVGQDATVMDTSEGVSNSDSAIIWYVVTGLVLGIVVVGCVVAVRVRQNR